MSDARAKMNDQSAPGARRLSDQEVLRAVPPTAGARHFRVGLFVILGIAGFFTILFLMTSPATFRGRYMLVTRVHDAQGIRKGDPVQMRGINIGRVHRFALEGDSVLITLEVEGEWQVPSGSRSELLSGGILGGTVVSVVPGPGPGALAPMTELPGAAVPGVFDSAGDLADDAGDVLGRIQALLSDSAVAGAGAAVSSLRDLLDELATVTASQADEVRSLLAALNRSAENVEGITGAEEWGRTLASADSALTGMSRTSRALEESVSSLNAVLARIERGEGTLGQLSANDSLYHSLDAAARSLKDLLDDLKANPSRYLSISVF